MKEGASCVPWTRVALVKEAHCVTLLCQLVPCFAQMLTIAILGAKLEPKTKNTPIHKAVVVMFLWSPRFSRSGEKASRVSR